MSCSEPAPIFRREAEPVLPTVSRRRFVLLSLAAVSAVTCRSAPQIGTAPTPSSSTRPAPPQVAPASPGTTRITLWHAMGGVSGDAVNQMVDGFNKSQNRIQVETVFQRTYDDALAELKKALTSNSAPALMQVYDIGLRYMVDSGDVVPIQQFLDAERFDTSDFEQTVMAYYTLDNRLYGMPFNTSSSILYYNKTAFKAAGLDPNQPPKTFDDVVAYARALTKKDGATVQQYGFNQAVYGWFFEQYMAVSGGYYVDHGNGRASRATSAVFNDARGQAILDWWKSGIQSGTFGNYGRVTNDNAAAFDSGRSAMYVESTSRMRSHINASQGKFELGTGFYPRPANAPANGGNIIGGACLYVLKSRPEAEQQAAWEFVKYSVSPPVQARWQADTGYYPVRKSAYDEPVSKDWVAKYPQFLTAVEQIRSVPVNHVTQGAVFGVFPQARQRIEQAIDDVLQGKSDSQTALDRAAADVTAAIQAYTTAPR